MLIIIDSKKLYPWKGPQVGGAYGYYKVIDSSHVLLYDHDRNIQALVWRDSYSWGQPIGGSEQIITAYRNGKDNRTNYMYWRTPQTDYWLGITTESDMRNIAYDIFANTHPKNS